MVVPRTSR